MWTPEPDNQNPTKPKSPIPNPQSSVIKLQFPHKKIKSQNTLPHNRVVMASKENQFSDLFHAYPGTFGSLGILAAATIKSYPNP